MRSPLGLMERLPPWQGFRHVWATTWWLTGLSSERVSNIFHLKRMHLDWELFWSIKIWFCKQCLWKHIRVTVVVVVLVLAEPLSLWICIDSSSLQQVQRDVCCSCSSRNFTYVCKLIYVACSLQACRISVQILGGAVSERCPEQFHPQTTIEQITISP